MDLRKLQAAGLRSFWMRSFVPSNLSKGRRMRRVLFHFKTRPRVHRNAVYWPEASSTRARHVALGRP
eukprot:6771605-Pyramimonas_sp.AAC.1